MNQLRNNVAYFPLFLHRTREIIKDVSRIGFYVHKGTDYSDRIKVSELIAQTSGLPDHEGDKPKRGKSVMDDLKAGQDLAIDTEKAIEIVCTLSPRFAPGKPHYSNANYCLLGAIIESVTEKPMAANYRR